MIKDSKKNVFEYSFFMEPIEKFKKILNATSQLCSAPSSSQEYKIIFSVFEFHNVQNG